MQVEGQQGEDLSSLLATGARVSNTYATCPCQGDKRWKRRLIPRKSLGGIPERRKVFGPDKDGHAAH